MKRYNWLEKLARWHAMYPGRMLIFSLILTLVFAALASQISVTMRWSDLLPAKDPRTVQYNKIVDEFVTATSIIIVVQGEEKAIKAFADTLAPKLETITVPKDDRPFPLIKRVDYKNEIEFLQNHGLMLMKADDLKNMNELFTDPAIDAFLTHLNNSMEAEYVFREAPLSNREKEDQAVQFLDGVDKIVAMLTHVAEEKPVSRQSVIQTADQFLFGEPYFLSYDKKTLIINAIPNFPVTDIQLAIEGSNAIQELIDKQLTKHPGISAGMTGFIPIARDEMVYSEQSLGMTSFIAIAAILILLIVSFRMLLAPVFAMGNLLLGIVWAMGIVAVLVGQLNIMTQMMAVILIGLGIDFSVHLISGFTEFRAQGLPVQNALSDAFTKIGKGVITGGLTTAFAFFTLMISQSRGMKEMGIVTGSGLLAILLASFLILPVFLVYRERFRGKRHQAVSKQDLSFEFIGKSGELLAKHYKLTFMSGLIITGLLAWSASRITFDSNYMNIEPEGIPSVTLQDTILHKFDLSTDYALILTDSPQASHLAASTCREMHSVAMTEDISLYLPTQEQQDKRRAYLEDIQKSMNRASLPSFVTGAAIQRMTNQIDRLRSNVIEMQSMAYLGGQDKVDQKCRHIVGDPEADHPNDRIDRLYRMFQKQGHSPAFQNQMDQIQNHFGPYFKSSVLQMAGTAPITLQDLPQTILDRYSNETRNQFLITVYPAGSVWQDADFLKRFVSDMESVSSKATGMPSVFYALIDIIGKDGRLAMLCTLLIVFLLLWLDFKSAKYALFAVIPLFTGLIWMVGLMHLTGQQFTAINVMGLPMILGIGIDDGVHIVHRWLAEGKGRLHIVFASTGKAILLTSLTTMLGFGSLIFSIWRGFAHLGAALFVGVGACFLTTLLFLSAILGWVEQRQD